MKLEQQVVSLELAQKLKELGVKQESFFKYGNVTTNDGVFWNIYVPPEYNKIPHPDLWVHGISAFSVAELGEMLLDNIIVEGNSYWYEERKTHISGGEIYYVVYYKFKHPLKGDVISFNGNTEADARAKMLIYLLENKLITV